MCSSDIRKLNYDYNYNIEMSTTIPAPELIAKTNRYYQVPVFLSHSTSNTLNVSRKKVRVIETNGATIYQKDVGQEYWTGSYFSFIEPAMAFQYGLPQLFITESTATSQDVYESGGIIMRAKIYFIYHSGFAVETENHILIFDYYKEKRKLGQKTLLPSLISSENTNKNVFVFSSHSHGDHFNKEIFQWEKHNNAINYILSNDIKSSPSNAAYFFMQEDDSREINDLQIKAFGSTDLGVSFLVKVDGINIFHAGDLNWWHWDDDSLEAQKTEENNFKLQIEKIKKEETIDIAFFPADPRLKQFYYLGGQYFENELQPHLLVPMHFGEKLNITKDFSDKIPNSVEISSFGQEIYYN